MQHFFLSSTAAAVPQRWREAFARGEALDALALMARLKGQPAQQCMVWLMAGNAQWPDLLQQVLQAQPGARIVLLSGAPDPQEGLQARGVEVEAGVLERRIDGVEHAGQRQEGDREHRDGLHQSQPAKAVDGEVLEPEQALGD